MWDTSFYVLNVLDSINIVGYLVLYNGRRYDAVWNYVYSKRYQHYKHEMKCNFHPFNIYHAHTMSKMVYYTTMTMTVLLKRYVENRC